MVSSHDPYSATPIRIGFTEYVPNLSDRDMLYGDRLAEIDKLTSEITSITLFETVTREYNRAVRGMPKFAKVCHGLFFGSLFCSSFSALSAPVAGPDAELVVTKWFESAVLTIKSSGAEGNKYGFEGGRVLKLHGVYHLFTSEMIGDP